MSSTLMVLLIGLQLMTFGVGNNDPAWVLEQHLQLGVTAAIVDDVPKVRHCHVLQLHLPRHPAISALHRTVERVWCDRCAWLRRR